MEALGLLEDGGTLPGKSRDGRINAEAQRKLGETLESLGIAGEGNGPYCSQLQPDKRSLLNVREKVKLDVEFKRLQDRGAAIDDDAYVDVARSVMNSNIGVYARGGLGPALTCHMKLWSFRRQQFVPAEAAVAANWSHGNMCDMT
ncbi:unnamed protein product [Symbiodinium sp. CCMP2592]|nr:unnamed protein product [Symbiodinium sp. CCMP2592]